MRYCDVREIGPAYPFLRTNLTSGNMFLPAWPMFCVTTRSTSSSPGPRASWPRRTKLWGESPRFRGVVSCRFLDVFGKRLVILQGEGLFAKTWQSEAQRKKDEDSYAPPVVRYGTHTKLEINPDYLEGLVGFETGKVYRPGLSVHLFEENVRIHGRYNRELEKMLPGRVRRRAGIRAGRLGWLPRGDEIQHFKAHVPCRRESQSCRLALQRLLLPTIPWTCFGEGSQSTGPSYSPWTNTRLVTALMTPVVSCVCPIS